MGDQEEKFLHQTGEIRSDHPRLAEALIELVHRARFDRLVALAEVQAALEEGKVNDQP